MSARHGEACGRNNAPGTALLTPQQLAEWLQVDVSYVYEHAAELGAYRLGSGKRARLRFDLEEVRRRLSACTGSSGSSRPVSASGVASRRKRRSDTGTNVALLPIRGRKPPSERAA